MSTFTEVLAANTFGRYLATRGWTRVENLPVGAYKADLATVTKLGVRVPALIEKLVSVYLASDWTTVYVEVKDTGIWMKRVDKAIADIPGIAADASKAEEVGKEVKRELTWVIVGVGALVVGLVGFIVWRKK